MSPACEGGQTAELIFRCDEALAATLIDAWGLAYTEVELTEIPARTALARLPEAPVPPSKLPKLPDPGTLRGHAAGRLGAAMAVVATCNELRALAKPIGNEALDAALGEAEAIAFEELCAAREVLEHGRGQR